MVPYYTTVYFSYLLLISPTYCLFLPPLKQTAIFVCPSDLGIVPTNRIWIQPCELMHGIVEILIDLGCVEEDKKKKRLCCAVLD